MVALVYFLINLLVFYIPLLYYYSNLRSSIISCVSSGDIYISLGISLSCSFVTVSKLFSLAILLPIKSPAAPVVFSITLFEVVLTASVADCLA